MGQQRPTIVTEKSAKTSKIIKKPTSLQKASEEKPKKPTSIKKPISKKKKRSQKYLKMKAKIEAGKLYSPEEALKLVFQNNQANFSAAIEIHIAFHGKLEKIIINKKAIIPDKNHNLHLKIGNISQKTNEILENLDQVFNQIKNIKFRKKDPIKSITLCTTMGPAIKLDKNIIQSGNKLEEK